MDWESEASALVEKVNAGIPAFVRGMVRRVVTKEAERLAREAGAALVGAEHVRRAYELRTPRPMQPLLLRALREEPGERGATPAADLPAAMPEFPVGVAMEGSEIERFLAWERTGRLGSADAEGRPYIVPLSFVYDRGAVYYHWFSEEGRKTRNVSSNKSVCFEADWSTRDHLSYMSVVADGQLEELSDVAEKSRILDLLAERFPEYATGAGHSDEIRGIIERGQDVMAEAVRIFRVRIGSITGKKKGRAPWDDAGR